MKKFLAIFAFIFLLAPMAQAFTVPEEIQVVPPKVSAENSSSSSITASGVTSAVRDAVKGSMSKVSDAIAVIKTAVNNKDTATSKSIDKQTDAIKNVGESVKDLDNKLTGKKGEFAKTNAKIDKANAMIDGVDSSLMMITGWLTFVIIAVGLICYFLTRKEVRVVGTKVEENPSATADMIRLQKVIPLTNVSGRNVQIRARTIAGKVRTLQIVSGQTIALENADDVPRIPAKSPTHLKSTNATILEEYFKGSFDGDDVPSKMQKKVVENAISEGEIEIL